MLARAGPTRGDDVGGGGFLQQCRSCAVSRGCEGPHSPQSRAPCPCPIAPSPISCWASSEVADGRGAAAIGPARKLRRPSPRRSGGQLSAFQRRHYLGAGGDPCFSGVVWGVAGTTARGAPPPAGRRPGERGAAGAEGGALHGRGTARANRGGDGAHPGARAAHMPEQTLGSPNHRFRAAALYRLETDPREGKGTWIEEYGLTWREKCSDCDRRPCAAHQVGTEEPPPRGRLPAICRPSPPTRLRLHPIALPPLLRSLHQELSLAFLPFLLPRACCPHRYRPPPGQC